MKIKLFEEFNMDVDKSDIGISVLNILTQVQIYHWQAEKMAWHKSFDEFSGSFKDLGDNLLEVIQGKYGRIVLAKKCNIDIKNTTELNPVKFIDENLEIFNAYRKEYENEEEIAAILDEVNALFERLKYLLTFE